MVHIRCQQVTKRFGATTALHHVDLAIDGGSRWGVAGASGAGKTTLLRILAGLERCTSGTVTRTWDGNTTIPRRIPLGVVFQNYGLWPHLTARQHLLYVLSAWPRRDRHNRAAELLAEVQLAASAWDRRPAELSGGEGQRVAVARALATDPVLMLLDEPLAQLHAALRDELLCMLAAVVQRRAMTLIYVSHSWEELAFLCRYVAVLNKGTIEQMGLVEDVYRRPLTPEVARLTGPFVEIPRRLLEQGLVARYIPDESWTATEDVEKDSLLVRPQQIRFSQPTAGIAWVVDSCRPHEAGWWISLSAGSERLELNASEWVRPNVAVSVTIGSAFPGG